MPVLATLARRNRVLDLWAAGGNKDLIAQIVRIDIDTVSRHLRQGRKAGDARAAVRHAATLRAITAGLPGDCYQEKST